MLFAPILMRKILTLFSSSQNNPTWLHAAQLDALDEQLVSLLHKRAALSIAAGRAKAGQTPVHQPERERLLLEKITQQKGPLPQKALLAIYEEILRTSRALQADNDFC